ncbi:MAG: magnesium/cobalt transporter CorA [Pseudomonadota bacterium]|nr:magnesium/cobalt transporter CorA [Pseudomonadota bacterium]
MLRAALFEETQEKPHLGGEEVIDLWRQNGNGWIWLDLDDEPADAERELLKNHFGISDLAIDDAQRPRHPPKLEFFTGYFFLLLRRFDVAEPGEAPAFVQLAFFVGERFLVTRRHKRAPSIDGTWEAMCQGGIEAGRGPAHICYKVIRRMIDRYTPIVLEVEKRIDELEEEMLNNPRDALLSELMALNRNLKNLRRIFSYQQGLMEDLRDSEFSLITGHVKHEFHDAYEHMERLASLSNLYQEIVVDMMNGYLSLASHRLNQIMKVLTIATVIFLPLTLMVGVYGMNFENMPELNARYGYYVLLTIMGFTATGLLMLFHRLRWL